jgi:hypothetical protein
VHLLGQPNAFARRTQRVLPLPPDAVLLTIAAAAAQVC